MAPAFVAPAAAAAAAAAGRPPLLRAPPVGPTTRPAPRPAPRAPPRRRRHPRAVTCDGAAPGAGDAADAAEPRPLGRRAVLGGGLAAAAAAALAGVAAPPPADAVAAEAAASAPVAVTPVAAPATAEAAAAAAGTPHQLAVFSVTASSSAPYHSTLERRSDYSVMDELAASSVIYLGETHSSAADHFVQARVIDELAARSSAPLTVALEMVERPFQPVLDAYIAGRLTDEQLYTDTEWADRWGWTFANYLPLFHACRRHAIPLLAMSLPADLVRRVRFGGGLEALSRGELTSVLPDPAGYAAYAGRPPYRQYVKDVVVPSFRHHIESGLLGDNPSFRGFWAAQSLWDESMASTIAAAAVGSGGGAAAAPRPTVVAVLGEQHVRYGWGVPRRVERLLGWYQARVGGGGGTRRRS